MQFLPKIVHKQVPRKPVDSRSWGLPLKTNKSCCLSCLPPRLPRGPAKGELPTSRKLKAVNPQLFFWRELPPVVLLLSSPPELQQPAQGRGTCLCIWKELERYTRPLQHGARVNPIPYTSRRYNLMWEPFEDHDFRYSGISMKRDSSKTLYRNIPILTNHPAGPPSSRTLAISTPRCLQEVATHLTAKTCQKTPRLEETVRPERARAWVSLQCSCPEQSCEGDMLVALLGPALLSIMHRKLMQPEQFSTAPKFLAPETLHPRALTFEVTVREAAQPHKTICCGKPAASSCHA